MPNNVLQPITRDSRIREEFIDNPSIAFWPVRNYLIVDRFDSMPIEVVWILHTSRNIAALLD
jgi:hypothetical protein